MKSPAADKNVSFIETPGGIFTAAGNWFHTTEAHLQDYAGPVLDKKPFASLIETAEIWLRSPATVVLWCTPFLLWKWGVWPTLVFDTGLYFILGLWAPVLTNLLVTPLLKILDNVLAQALLYILLMSWFAMNDQFMLMASGLMLFILVRWGIIAKIFGGFIDKLHSRMYNVPFSDQVLKSVIVRNAMKLGVSLPELDNMERSILNQLHKK